MVAVVSGNGLGLTNTSLNTLGSQGAVGAAAEGKAGEQVYVNSSNGDLIIQEQDDYLSGLGLDLPLVRTYNSQGQLADDVGGNWRLGVSERLINMTGTPNTAGSTVTKVFGDEAETVYVYNAAQGKYIATGQSGALDQLTYNATNQQWTWQDGSTESKETYDATGRLLFAQDADGNTRTYTYVGSLLTQVTDASGQTVNFDYTGSNLTQVRVVTPQGQTQTLTHYFYDSQNRLSQVKVDLSPQDNAISDNNIYTTTYAYDGTSNRIVSIAHSDGTTVSFSYEQAGSAYRVKTYTEGDRRVVTASANSSVLQNTRTQTVTNTYNETTSALTPPHWTESWFDNAATNEEVSDAAFNQNGDGFAILELTVAGNPSLVSYVSKYTAATQTWSTPTQLVAPNGATAGLSKVAVDQQGNAVMAWVAAGNVYASVYNKAANTWSSAQTIATSPGNFAAQMHLSINGTNAAVTFGNFPTSAGGFTTYNLYVARMVNNSWGSAQVVQSGISLYSNSFASDNLGIDAQGNVTLLYTDANSSTSSLYSKRFTASSGTWSAAQTLDTSADGVNAFDAINQVQFLFDVNGNGFALWRRGSDHDTSVVNQILEARWDHGSGSWSPSTVMDTNSNSFSSFGGGPTLTTDTQGNVLAMWVNESVVNANVFSGATQSWSGIHPAAAGGTANIIDIANSQHVVSAVSQLVQYVNGVWQTPQIGSPASLGSSDPTFMAITPSGDVETIEQVFDYYGHNGGFGLKAAHYTNQYSYSVPAGASWASIGQAIYGSADVASQLQAAMGNPTLTTGLTLLNLPASITVSSSVVVSVPPYYTVVAGDTWSTIAQKVYGTTDPAAASALQTALGNAALTAGAQLTVPASLSYTLTVGDQATTLTYTSSTGSSNPVTASANPNAVTTTSTSNQTYGVNSGALSTTDTVNQAYNLNTGALSGSSGTISFVQGNTQDASTPDTASLTFTDAQTAGNLNVVTVGWSSTTATVTSVTDSVGNVYTLAGSVTTTGFASMAIYYAKNIVGAAAGANTCTVTFSGPVDWPDIRAAEYQGADQTNPLDGMVGSTGDSQTLDSGSLTTTHASDVLVGASYVENELTGAGSSFTQREMSGGGEILEDQTVSSVGTYNATAPQDLSGWWIMQLAAFKAAAGSGTYYVVPSGATWQSVANALYGVNSAVAGTALQTAMGNAALTAGAHLTGMPATLNVSTTQTVPAYFTISSGASWQSIANTLYGANSVAAGAALQTAMGNPALTAGNRLTGLPSTLTVSSTVTVPAYYAVPAVATWTSITQAVYATSDANAVSALQQATGLPTLTTGLQLVVPLTLTYVPASSNVTASANSSVLSTTDTVNQAYGLNTGALSGSSGSISFVQANYSNPSNANTVTIPFTDAQTAGNLNVIALGWISSTATITSVTDSEGNVYTRAGSVTSDGNESTAIYYAKNIAGAAAGANTVTVTFSNAVDYPDIRTAEYQGADQTNPLDGMIGSTGNSQALDSGALTTTNASDLLVGSSYVADVVTGPGSQFTQREMSSGGEILEDRAVSSVGTYDATAPQASSGWWVMQMAAFKAASGSGTYYTVPSGATWQSVANALYGVNSAAAGTALQTALGNPALTAGANLTGLPATLNVSTTSTVPAYYTVPAGASWASITQAVYGTSDANAVTALQVALGNPTLTTGLHLVVPSTLSYSASVSVTRLQTDITDALGQTTTYLSDSSGRLTSILSPATGGTRLRTDYSYDANGNVTSITQDPTGLDRVTTMAYDANGNLLLTRDAMGDTVTRTYSATNKLLTETQYLTPDPDGAGAAQPGDPVTTRYAYDSEDHLRFSVSADGRVTEFRYNAQGELVATLKYTSTTYSVGPLGPTDTVTEAQLSTWATARDLTQVERTDYVYDFRGNLSTKTVYASTDSTGAGVAASAAVTHYVYDQRGLLLQTIDPRSTSGSSGAYTTTFVYDGLGRVTSSTEWIDGSTTSTQLTTYDAANNRTVTTLANGLVTTSNYDHAGRLTSVVESNSSGQSLGTTTYSYDADGRLRMTTDADGDRQYILYDETGRKVADIDSTGALTQYVYNSASEIVKTVRYADTLTSAQVASLIDAQGNPASAGVSTLVANLPATVGRASDQITRSVYDKDGRKQYTIDAGGDVTQYFYDGESRVTDEVQYATPITIASSVGEVLPSAISVTSNPADRHTRNFYDNDGDLTGTLDATGYLVEYTYDAAGQLTQQTGYATPTSSSLRSAGTLAQLRPTADTTHDITSHFFYDEEGRQVGVLDGEGYLTETVYDPNGNASQQIRYGNVVTYSAGAALATLRPSSGPSHTTSYQYDGANRVVQVTNYEGTVQSQSYDAVGNLISTTTAVGTADTRTTQSQYDSLGRVTAELTAQGSSLIVAGTTQAQINAIWNQYAVHYTYDLLGRRISATDPNNHTTLYFYDADGRLTYTVNALGEVTENRYNVLGQLTDTISYATRIPTTSLTGGSQTDALAARVAAIANPAKDARTSMTYSLTGKLASQTTAAGAGSTYSYDAFGDQSGSVEKIDSTHSLTHSYGYDARGLLTSTVWDPHGLDTTQSETYDAFGRLTSVTDSNGNTAHTEYDRLGRQVAAVDALGDRSTTTYDAFSRALTVKDALQNTTTYTYDDSSRSVVVTTPEGISATTVHNREGQTLSLTAAGQTTSYVYDANGQLKTVSDNLGTLEGRTYDAVGNLLTDTDARGTVTTFTYDAANRALTKTVDSATGGLGLVTTYVYDAEGRTVQVTDPQGKVTATTYDQDGHVLVVDQDPTGLDLRTTYTYDAAGDVLTVIEGYGSAATRKTQYVYDTLGRRTQEIVDPTSLGGSLNITTQYKYDADGNVTRKIDANGSSTWYVYDASDRLRYTVDALGGVTETTYDADNRVLATHRYATAISTSSLGDVVTSVAVTVNSADRVTQSIYDRDGRNVYSVGPTGVVTERQFDAAGRVIRERTYSDAIAAGTYASVSAVQTALGTVRSNINSIGASDEVTWIAYDLRGDAIFTVDGLGDVVQKTYDASGNVTQTTAYATRYTGSAMDLASLQGWASGNTNAADRTTLYWYDTTGRLRFEFDADHSLHETRYDDAARTQTKILYGVPANIGAGASLASVASTAQTLQSDNFSQTTGVTFFDTLGRVSSVRDGSGSLQSYVYDAVGNKISYTNQANSTWNYDYDAAGRLTKQTDPAVAVTTVTGSASALSASAATSVRLQTVFQYDALGNLLSKTDAANTAQARTTSYTYDALGRQIRTTPPSVGVYNEAADNPAASGTSVVRTENTPTLYTETAYDTLGNAYRGRDVSGNYSFKVYDAAGRVIDEVDAGGYLTSYSYDAFGNQAKLTRYANALTSPLSTTSASISDADIAARKSANPAADRAITTTHDVDNRVTQVTMPAAINFEPGATVSGGPTFSAGATTLTEYNSFGDIIRARQLVSAGTYADTYYYRDSMGREIAEVDPLGYITTYTYDTAGNVLTKSEFAQALAAGTWNLSTFATPVKTTPLNSPTASSGWDRVTDYTYDALNRKTREVLENFDSYSISQLDHILTRGDANRETDYAYDAVGNLVEVTTAGVSTFTYYDAMGHVVGVAGPRSNMTGTVDSQGNPIDQEWTPFTEYRLDAFGDVVEQIQHAADAGVLTAGVLPVLTAAAGDRKILVLTDAQGRAIQTQDAAGNQSFASYDARGDLAKEWKPVTNNDHVVETMVTIHEYDALGHETATIEPQSSGGVVVRTQMQYDAFGEMISKGVYNNTDYINGNITGPQEYFDYDQAGRLWRTNSGDEVDRVYLYDLAGHATAQIVSQTVNLHTVADANAADALTGTIRTETVYDLDGRVIQQRAPQFTVTNTQDLIAASPSISTMATPVPPGAIYQQVTQFNYYTDEFDQYFYVVNPTSIANGGGYVEVSAPTADNPDGVYQQVDTSSYQVVQAKQLHWAAPAEIDTVATFTYWPLSNPSAVQSLDVHKVSQVGIGVNISSLASGQYGYTISYTRTGASSAYATQTGTFDSGSGAVTVNSGASVSAQTATPTTYQTSDRWGNVISVKDAGGGITQYRYDQLGNLTFTLLPTVDTLDTRVSIDDQVTRSQTGNYYDVHGNVIETQDGNGHSTRQTYNAAGQVLTHQDPDAGGIVRNTYDSFGNLIQTIDELGYKTRNVYDVNNHLIESAQELSLNTFTNADPTDLTNNLAANIIFQRYSYDAAGRRITSTNGEGELTKDWYDLQGHVVREQTPMLFNTTYQYDLRGNKTRTTDGDGSVETWTYDAAGRLTGRTDLQNTADYGVGGGTSYVYGYDSAGEMTSQTDTSLGIHIVTAYDTAGHVTSITDTGTAVGGTGLLSSSTTTTYTYDAAGRDARETVVVDGRQQQDTRITYDALGRISTLDDPDYRLTYRYDGAGNRTEIVDDFVDHTGLQQHQELYYRYDAANRVIISQGVKTTGSVPDITINAGQGSILTYDAKGDRTSVTTAGTVYNETITTGPSGTADIYHWDEVAGTNGLSTTDYDYDGAGRLLLTEKETNQTIHNTVTGTSTTTSTVTIVDTHSYDQASRLTEDINDSVVNGVISEQVVMTGFDDDGRETTQTTKQNGNLQSVVTFGSSTLNASTHTWGIGYDAADVLRGYTVDVYNSSGTYQYTTTYKETYRLSSSYLQSVETAHSVGTNAPLDGSTTRTYNVDGFLVQYTDAAAPQNDRYFANDAEGHTLATIEGQFDGQNGRMTVSQAWDIAQYRNQWIGTYNAPQAQYFFFADGNYIGSFGQLQSADGSFAANFDVNYTPVSSQYPANAPSKVVVQSGDTLRIIAARVYGDSSLWYLIAQKNGLTDPDAQLSAGTTLTIPNDVVALPNSSSSFKPFDPSAAIGDTTPTQPSPPPPQQHGGGCGVFGQILEIAVAIVVTYLTAGSTSSLVLSGLISGAAGAAASQVVAIADGDQKGFNWKGVALGAIGGAVTAGIGETGLGSSLGSVGQAAAQAAASSVVTQGIGVVTGLQKSFSWNAVAISAASAGAAREVGQQIDPNFGTKGYQPSGLTSFAASTAGAVASVGAQFALHGKVQTSQVLSDVFGNILGNGVVDTYADNGVASVQFGEISQQLSADVAQGEADAAGQVSERLSDTLTSRASAIDTMFAGRQALFDETSQTVQDSAAVFSAQLKQSIQAETGTITPINFPQDPAAPAGAISDSTPVNYSSVGPIQGSFVGSFVGSYVSGVQRAWENFQANMNGYAPLIDPTTVVPGLLHTAGSALSFLRDAALTAIPGDKFFSWGQEAEARNAALGAEWRSDISGFVGEHVATYESALNAYAAGDSVSAGGILGEQRFNDDAAATKAAFKYLGPVALSRVALLADAVDVEAVANAGANASAAATPAPVSSKPAWLQRLDAGNDFNAQRAPAYPYNEVYIDSPDGVGYPRLDSYDPAAGEIVSRKFTQLSDVQTKTAVGYINEIPAKYPVGATVADVPSSGLLAGQPLQGQYILEVPVQIKPVPQPVLDAADRAGVLIRDVNGTIY